MSFFTGKASPAKTLQQRLAVIRACLTPVCRSIRKPKVWKIDFLVVSLEDSPLEMSRSLERSWSEHPLVTTSRLLLNVYGNREKMFYWSLQFHCEKTVLAVETDGLEKTQRKPLLTTEQRKWCLEWASKYSKWSNADWETVLLSNENTFCILGDHGKTSIRRFCWLVVDLLLTAFMIHWTKHLSEAYNQSYGMGLHGSSTFSAIFGLIFISHALQKYSALIWLRIWRLIGRRSADFHCLPVVKIHLKSKI